MNSKTYDVLQIGDYLIFILILFLTWSFTWWGLRSKNAEKNPESWLELLAMSRKMTLPFFVTSLMATWYGGIFGVTTLAFEKGVYNFLTQGVFWYLAYITFALVIIPRIQQKEEISLPELVGEKIGPHSKKIVMFISYLNFLPIAYILSLGLFIQMMTGLSLMLCCSIGLFLSFTYSLIGGFRSIVYSEFVQAITMILSVSSVVVWSMLHHGSPLLLLDILPPSHFDWTGGETLLSTLVWGFIAFSTLVDPTFYQRTLIVKDKKLAQKGILITTCLWFFFDICTTLGALYARAYASHFPSDQAYLQYGLNLLPHGLRGLFLAGILATILSTLDAYLFSAGSLISYDVFGKKLFTQKKLILSIFVSGIISLVIIPFFDGKVVNVWKIMGGFSAACLFIPWTYSLFTKTKISDLYFFLSVLNGMIMMVVGHFVIIHLNLNLDHFYFGAFGSGITLLFGKCIHLWNNSAQS